jgi:hypothetical protein
MIDSPNIKTYDKQEDLSEIEDISDDLVQNISNQLKKLLADFYEETLEEN